MKCIVLDSSALFHLRDVHTLLSLGDKFYTTNFVISEVKDSRTIAVLDILSLNIVEINLKEIEYFRKKYGLSGNLSNADVSIVILALKLKNECSELQVITDDLELAKVLKRFNINVQRVFFRKRFSRM